MMTLMLSCFEPKLHISASYEHPPVDDKNPMMRVRTCQFIVTNIHIFSLKILLAVWFGCLPN